MTGFHELAEHLDATETVAIVTTRASGEELATPIWAVVVDGRPYVRSAFGGRAAWNRHARSGRPVAFTLVDGSRAERDAAAALDDPRLAVRATLLPADADVHDAVDAAFRAKYPGTPHVEPLLTDEARALTLRIDPV